MNKLITTALLISAVTLSTAGCHRTKTEGPAEHAGKKIDNAVERTEESASKAKENLKSAGRDVRDDVRRGHID